MTQLSEKFEFKEISCPICDGPDAELVGYRGGNAHQNGQGIRTRIVRCRSCTHQYPNPMPFPAVDLDEIYTDTDEYFKRHNLEAKKNTSLKLMKEFERRLGRKGDFLDVGSGRGELIWAARERGWNWRGVDPSRHFVEFGKETLGIEGTVGTISDANFPDASFDAVAMGGIIEHLYNPDEVLREIQRVLRPGGWLYFDAPNEDGLYMTVGNLYMKLRRKDWVVVMAPTFPPYHVQGFNPESLKYLLNKLNFSLRSLKIHGEISPQLGDSSLRKSVEFLAGRIVNALGNVSGRGMYMHAWVQKV